MHPSQVHAIQRSENGFWKWPRHQCLPQLCWVSEIHFLVRTNTFWNGDKYISQLQIQIHWCQYSVVYKLFEWIESNYCHLLWTSLILLQVIKMSVFDTIKEIPQTEKQGYEIYFFKMILKKIDQKAMESLKNSSLNWFLADGNKLVWQRWWKNWFYDLIVRSLIEVVFILKYF